MDPEIAIQLTCPMSQELLEDPYLCMHCQGSFSRAQVERWLAACSGTAHCPTCRGEWQMDVTLQPNRPLRNLLATLANGGSTTHVAPNLGDGMTFHFRKPFQLIVAGASGSGKSTGLNKLVDPSGDTEVAREGSGARGVTQGMSVVFNGRIGFRDGSLNVVLHDTKGFNDADESNVNLLRRLSEGMLQVGLGMDAIVHFVRMARQTEGDRQLPALLLDGLAHTEAAKAELAQRWVIVVTHCDSARRPVTLEEIEQFRGELLAFFPEVLAPAVQRAIFIENGPRDSSPYANAEKNRDALLTQVITCRQVYHKSFHARNLDELIGSAVLDTLRHQPHLSEALDGMDSQQLSALQQHFDTVNTVKAWMPITPAVPVPPAFCEAWNSLSIAVRDEVAAQVASAVCDEVRTRCRAKMGEEIHAAIRRHPYAGLAAAVHKCTLM
mmetsp:Transcript_63011/g.117193  ORF Transcript_63011/g.117193 Transcript_63011/m.117193 type:complete len:438 (+) Transcript_63011:68-1381(+)